MKKKRVKGQHQGEQLRLLMESRGLSMKEIAERLGVSHQAISKSFGKATLGPKVLYSYTAAMNATPDDLRNLPVAPVQDAESSFSTGWSVLIKVAEEVDPNGTTADVLRLLRDLDAPGRREVRGIAMGLLRHPPKKP